MTNLAGKPPLGLKQKQGEESEEYLRQVRGKGCCICRRFGEQQRSPTKAHHVIHDRFGTRKRLGQVIPLCEGHHQGLFDTSKIAIHQRPALWRETYGPDYSYLGGNNE